MSSSVEGAPKDSPRSPTPELPQDAELTIIVVSYNTRDLTLKCLETLYASTHTTRFRCVVVDNQSKDGSADAIEAAFPQVDLIRAEDNLGFAKANNVVAAAAETEWLLLLNPDTEVFDGAVDTLLAFACANPQAGITGGRTVFRDGTLNPTSCLNRITPWSVFCFAFGLLAIGKRLGIGAFNPEGLGNWQRDTVRQVDIIQGCWLMIPRALWDELQGFDLRYYMYGEDFDLCLRAGRLGYRPMFTPEAEIMHIQGASSPTQGPKYAMIAKARVTLMRENWPKWQVPFGVAMMWCWPAMRNVAFKLLGKSQTEAGQLWAYVWKDRHDWLKGY